MDAVLNLFNSIWIFCNQNKVMSHLICICYTILGLWILYMLFLAIWFFLPSFDGAMNLQVSQNMAKYGLYATSYDGFRMFGSELQTGAPVILPIALLFVVFGESYRLANVINAAYFLLFVGVSQHYLKKQGLKDYICICFLISFLFTTELFSFSFGVYGEIPCLALYMSSVFFYFKLQNTGRYRYAMWMGLCFGLAYLTKTVILIAVPFLILIIMLDIVLLKNVNFTKYLVFSASFLLPVLLFELFKLYQLGVSSYYDWWISQFDDILYQAGISSLTSSELPILSKGILHYNMLCNQYHFPRLLFPILILLNLAIPMKAVFCYAKKEKIQLSTLWIWTTMMSYYGWWILITPTEKAWARRIIIGHILLVLCTWISIQVVVKFIHNQELIPKLKIMHKKIVVILSVVLALELFILVQIPTSNIKVFLPCNYSTLQQNKNEYEPIVAIIDELPEDSVFLGFGWWQAPVISFLADIDVWISQTVDNCNRCFCVCNRKW